MRPLLSPPHTPLERGWRDQGRHDDHDDDGRVERWADERPAVGSEAEADVREDEPDLTAGDHSDSDGKAINAWTDDPGRTSLLANNRRDRQSDGDSENSRLAERTDIGSHSHEDEENRNQESGNGMHE